MRISDWSSDVCSSDLRSFDSDRLSRRNFRHLLTRGKAACLVEEEEGRIRGYVMLLFHGGTSLARLYSLAVDPEHRGQGIGEALLKAAEACALERDNAYLRLEVRPDNHAAIRLYEQAGYRVFDQVRSEEHTSELQSLMRISYAVFCLKKKKQ